MGARGLRIDSVSFQMGKSLWSFSEADLACGRRHGPYKVPKVRRTDHKPTYIPSPKSRVGKCIDFDHLASRETPPEHIRHHNVRAPFVPAGNVADRP